VTVRAAPELVALEDVRVGDVVALPRGVDVEISKVRRYDDGSIVLIYVSNFELSFENRAQSYGPRLTHGRFEKSLAFRRPGELVPLARRARSVLDGLDRPDRVEVIGGAACEIAADREDPVAPTGPGEEGVADAPGRSRDDEHGGVDCLAILQQAQVSEAGHGRRDPTTTGGGT
jgi:hypothetical protein